MTVRYRVIAICLAERLARNRAYAEEIGVTVEMKRRSKMVVADSKKKN